MSLPAVLIRLAPLLVLTLTACAPRLTPRQELTWDAYKACQHEGPSTNLDRVRPDGGWHVVGREGEVYKVHGCMLAYWEQASRDGRLPPLPPSVKVTAAAPATTGLVVASPPAWSPGDLWRFASQGPGSRRGAYNWRMQREDEVEGVAYYVMKSGTREVFHRKSDLAVAHEAVNDRVVIRNTPARLYFVWPLATGARWDQTYRHERPEDHRAFDHVYEGRVESEETVTVPAGTFKTLRIAYRNEPKKAIAWEQWYSPEARIWVRMRESLEDGVRITELQSFELRSPGGRQAQASQSHVRAASVTDSSTSSSSR